MKNTFKKLLAILVVTLMILPMLSVPVHAASYIWPLDSSNDYITSYAGNRIHPLTGERQNHSGIDIRASKGSSVYATASGTAYIGCNWCSHNYGKSKSCGCGGGYGNYIYIVHNNGMVSYYAHLTKVLIDDGEYVSQGSKIGTVGSTGSSTGYHLHFEIRTSTSRDDRKDPLDYVSVPGDDYTPVIPEENTSSSGSSSSTSTFNPNVVEYYTGFVSGNQNSSNVYDTYEPSVSTPSVSKPSVGQIEIDMTSYPKALDKGESFNLKGTITADEDITRVLGRIMSESGSTVQSIPVCPDAKKLNVNKSDINKKLRFGSLPEGTYSLLIEVTDEEGNTASWQQSFTVGRAQSSDTSVQLPTESGTVTGTAIDFDVTKYPVEIKHGSSFSLRGTISSSTRIGTLHGYILDAAGNEVQSTKDTPNAKSVNIKSKNVNKKLAFGKLSKGSYTLKMVAVDNDGNVGTWEKAFIVK